MGRGYIRKQSSRILEKCDAYFRTEGVRKRMDRQKFVRFARHTIDNVLGCGKLGLYEHF